MPYPICLIILDGWGTREGSLYNPIQTTPTPTMDHLLGTACSTQLTASGEAVGLPAGQMGNSEVGHLHIGAGRKIPQDLTRIQQVIASKTFEDNPVLQHALKAAKTRQAAVHVIGLLSPGGVHSHEAHILAMIQMIAHHGIEQNYCHAILDGRDTPPQSARASLDKVHTLYQSLPGGKIATLVGRYYAMDRDQRWERTQKAYDLLTQKGPVHHAPDPLTALDAAYARGETDEFVTPTAIYDEASPRVILKDQDVVIFMNFRADRARQLTQALTDKTFSGFSRQHFPHLSQFVSLTQYDENFGLPVAFPPLDLHNTLGEVIANQGLRQLRIAETEKYAHVTYFLNGGRETPYPKEDRVLIPSPKVATYDLQPEMSAERLTDQLVEAIQSGQYDAIFCNFANPDMVGHTGNEQAACEAVKTIDACLARILSALSSVGGEALITADHGNIELMYDTSTQQPHTAHTTCQVPFLYVGRPARIVVNDGALDDIAPTMLYLMGLTPPPEMTGRCLLQLDP